MTLILPEYHEERVFDVSILESLGLNTEDPLVQFYQQNQGPFSSEQTGFTLLDIVDEDPLGTVVSQTPIAHDELDIPSRYLVISNLLGGSVIMYDVATTAVFDVDFEGSEKLLAKNMLEPLFSQLGDFLNWYFS